MGNGGPREAFATEGEVENGGVIGAVGKVMAGLGLVGRGKDVIGKKRRKGMDGLIDV